jgi:hypothetical protein
MNEITILRADGRELREDWEIRPLVGDLCEQAVARFTAEVKLLVARQIRRTLNRMRGRADLDE